MAKHGKHPRQIKKNQSSHLHELRFPIRIFPFKPKLTIFIASAATRALLSTYSTWPCMPSLWSRCPSWTLGSRWSTAIWTKNKKQHNCDGFYWMMIVRNNVLIFSRISIWYCKHDAHENLSFSFLLNIVEICPNGHDGYSCLFFAPHDHHIRSRLGVGRRTRKTNTTAFPYSIDSIFDMFWNEKKQSLNEGKAIQKSFQIYTNPQFAAE